MFQAILEDAAPIDLQLLGRVLIHAIAVGAACGFVACGLYVALELAQHVSISYLAGYAWIGAAGEILDVEGFDASIERP